MRKRGKVIDPRGPYLVLVALMVWGIACGDSGHTLGRDKGAGGAGAGGGTATGIGGSGIGGAGAGTGGVGAGMGGAVGSGGRAAGTGGGAGGAGGTGTGGCSGAACGPDGGASDGGAGSSCSDGIASCGAGLFCYRSPPARCGDSAAIGVCVVPPAACVDLPMQVCGCDGRTYVNQCDMLWHRVQLDHAGICQHPDGGAAPVLCGGTICAPGELCIHPCAGCALPTACQGSSPPRPYCAGTLPLCGAFTQAGHAYCACPPAPPDGGAAGPG